MGIEGLGRWSSPDDESEQRRQPIHDERRLWSTTDKTAIDRSLAGPSTSFGGSVEKRRTAEIREGLAPFRVVACNVRGLQVGDHNLQINTYVYEVKQPRVNLSDVLERPQVKLALANLRNDPNSGALRRRADRALASVAPGWLSKPGDPVKSVKGTSGGRRYTGSITSFLFVDRSQGIQVGDHVTQRNHYVYTVASSKHVAELLAGRRQVRAAIVDCFCSANQNRAIDALGGQISRSLKASVEASRSIRKAGDVYPGFRTGELHIKDVDGVAVGNDLAQKNAAQVNVDLGPGATRSLRKSIDSIDEITAAKRDTRQPPPPQRVRPIPKDADETPSRLPDRPGYRKGLHSDGLPSLAPRSQPFADWSDRSTIRKNPVDREERHRPNPGFCDI
jgi:hypothetical protein